MTNQWDADILINEELAVKLIDEQFPDLSPVNAEFIGEGWDNAAFLINNKYVFRFPRRKVAQRNLIIENRLLPKISSLLPLPVPKPLFIGRPSGDYEFEFSGYEMLKGRMACMVDLSVEDRIDMAKPLALFLKTLHSIERDKIRSSEVKLEAGKMLNVPRRIKQANELLDKFEEMELDVDVTGLRKIVKETSEKPQSDKKVLCHGNLYSRHILVNKDKKICGIIDWGDLCIENPALDLSIVYDFLPGKAREVFWEHYGEIEESIKMTARFFALTLTCLLLHYSIGIKDEDLKRESLWGFDFIREWE